jgi:hypothetical protein
MKSNNILGIETPLILVERWPIPHSRFASRLDRGSPERMDKRENQEKTRLKSPNLQAIISKRRIALGGVFCEATYNDRNVGSDSFGRW